MYTIVESEVFKNKVQEIWEDEERLEFFAYVARDPLCGDIIPGAAGMRKVRWYAPGRGKRGGVRVIYYNLLEQGKIMMYYIYLKNEIENIAPKKLINLFRGKNEIR